MDLAVDASLAGVSVAGPDFSLELVGARRGNRIPVRRLDEVIRAASRPTG